VAGAVQRRGGYGTVAALPPRHWLPGGAGGLQKSLSLLLARSVCRLHVIDTFAKTITLSRLCIGHYCSIPALLSHELFIGNNDNAKTSADFAFAKPVTTCNCIFFWRTHNRVFTPFLFDPVKKDSIVTILPCQDLNGCSFCYPCSFRVYDSRLGCLCKD